MAVLTAVLALAGAIGQISAQSDQSPARWAAEATRLAEVLDVKPGATVADIGAGHGEMTVEMAKRVGDGRVYATDISPDSLAAIRKAAAAEHLTNVIVLEGAERSTNLPNACCDAIIIRNVYHHFPDPAAMGRSVAAAMKPGGRLAIIDFEPSPGSERPPGVPANRGGHGIRAPLVIEEITAAGLASVQTIMDWPDGQPPVFQRGFLVLFQKPR